MNFQIINNLSNSNNHSERLKELFNESDSIILTSPFLMTDFSDFLGEIESLSLSKLHLITTLSPKSFDQIKKISSLISLIEFPAIKEEKINCQISINNKLHGKVYIFKKGNEYISSIISSANFTDSGLMRNHEWGVEIKDHNEIEKLERSIIESIEFPELSFDQIYLMQQMTTDFMESQPQVERRDIELNLTSILISENKNQEFDETVNFWLKPIGVSNNPVSEDRTFDQLTDNLHFSKQRPNGVKPNDILISYGVGTTKILSIYRVTSFPTAVTKEELAKVGNWLERWPWYVQAENLTPYYGRIWTNHNLHKNGLLQEYLAINPHDPITAVGGKTLGALNFGKDKLKLAPEFAKFIINKVMVINNQLTK